MNRIIDLRTLRPATREFLRAVAAFCAWHTRMTNAARLLGGGSLGFEVRASERAQASVSRKFRGLRFILSTRDEVKAFRAFLNTAVEALAEYERRGRMVRAEREIHRFSRSLLLNALSGDEDAA